MHLLSTIILYFSNLSALFPVATGWKVKGLLWYYVWVSLVSDIAGYVIERQHWPRFIHANLFLLLEFILITKYLLNLIISPSWRKTAHIPVLILSAIFVLRTILRTPIQTNYEDGAIFYTIYIVLCILVLHGVMVKQEDLRLDQSETFIVSTAFLLYASGSMIILLYKITVNATDQGLMNRIWDVRNVLNILKNFAIGYMFIVKRRKTSFEK